MVEGVEKGVAASQIEVTLYEELRAEYEQVLDRIAWYETRYWQVPQRLVDEVIRLGRLMDEVR